MCGGETVMLKRLYSRRSGFTLVEIIVAFALFAVMSTAIAGIMQMATTERRKNNEYGQQLADQEKLLAQVVKNGNNYDTSFTDADKYGTYGLVFKKKDSSNNVVVGEEYDASLAYAVKGADGTDTAEGLNYFISPVKYDGKYDGSGAGSGQLGGGGDNAQEYSGSLSTGIADVRISATRGTDYVKIHSIQKVTAPSGVGARYVFKTSANSAGTTPQEKAYAQYILYFYMSEEDCVTIKKDDIRSSKKITGNKNDGTEFKYTQDVPLAAKIVNAGWCDDSGNPLNNQPNSKPVVETTCMNTVRVGVPYKDNGGNLETNNNFSGTGFTGEVVTFYVDFKEDPNISVDTFGDNGVGGVFTRYNLATSNGYQNLIMYGGFKYVMRDTDGNIITSLD